VDVGSYRKGNDATIFNVSFVGKGFTSGKFDKPHPESIARHTLPFVIVANEFFDLGNYLIQSRRVFNYRLSRCHRTIEMPWVF